MGLIKGAFRCLYWGAKALTTVVSFITAAVIATGVLAIIYLWVKYVAKVHFSIDW